MSEHTTYELRKQVQPFASADVIVIGGGPAGTAAAISAARRGKQVIVLEKSAQLGGMGTLGNVSIFMPIGNVTGIYRELIAEVLREYLPEQHDQSIAPQYSPFILRHYLNEKMKKEGVQVIYHAEFVGAIREGSRLKAVIASTRQGLVAFEGRQFIDCTGDARVAIDAGVPYTSGRDEDGLTQPMTLMFMMQNTGKPVTPILPEGCYYYESKEDLPQGRHLFWERNQEGTLLVNMTRVKGNGAKIDDVNYAETESLRQVFSVVNYLQRNGFETYVLSHVANQIGVRETNQIRGLYTLTEQDVVGGRRFEDVVAQTNYEIDIHSPDGKKTTDERKVSGYDIPYRCMVSGELDNLLVAGRSISATHVAMSSMRVQPTCYALGQAAGIAAALAIDEACDVRGVPVQALHEGLREQNVVFVK
ncbi:FAD dependent oxidoreductase [Paenibacillus sp. UNCCL117]|uniref:FAD-dependent oxidoreductase n=1 Tax=unclassified Paenibacillus TaxID=185978 RepID=UPI00088C68FA|nr:MULTISPECIES: FAD-dependent oxidoreductase [unclassified Paenibacillus]SDE49360.1 FAD dependent oxidoreductase [Paenibacillus sp. cl123]SFW66871.1 FAD dependent oxidoreductase [Paenibacillus sp. UNCCL117]